MTRRSWLVITAGFGVLIGLILLMGLGAMRQSKSILDETLVAHDAYLETEVALRGVPADLNLAGIFVRDYLLDPSHLSADYYRNELRAIRESAERRLKILKGHLTVADAGLLERLHKEVDAYWDSVDPLLGWTPAQKAIFSSAFLRERILPRRNAVVAITREITKIQSERLKQEQRRLRESQRRLEAFLRGMLAFSLVLGLVVAGISTARVAVLERHSELERARAEKAEAEMRRLSRNLVQAQEDERKTLSRELHDAVGQMLSAMNMELANLDTLHDSSPARFRERLKDAKKLNSDTIHAVRDLAMGLRPSMLDELGLGPALRWQAREFSRRSQIPVDVQIDGQVDQLPDEHRTAIYRIVQEALTNCARHAGARQIRISLYGRTDWLSLTVSDDGVGFQQEGRASRGLGLIGIEERARELGGKLTVITQPGRGTILEVELPLPVRGAA
jgi:signal transduction histidine kinase